jgi:hypothetical protein
MSVVFLAHSIYHSTVHRWLIGVIIICSFGFSVLPTTAASARVMKVLPHFLDTNGLHTLHPSLYERDAYQAYLREHPDKRSGIRFDVRWKNTAPVFGQLKLRIELRGIAEANLPRQKVLEQVVEPGGGWLGRWTSLALSGEEYRQFGEVTAWRVTLWQDDEPLAEQRSFLW